ncbi:MAG: prenyltransferase/squalene oxidase repeat-containing protein, partial [Planctomycetia bacterium]
MRHVCPSIAALCLCAIGLATPVRAADAEPLSPERIQRAIEKARDWLVREQAGDGSWECAMRTQDTRVGATALVMLALANAGVKAEDPALRKSLDWLRRQEPEETYSVSLQTMVLAMLAPTADRAILQRNVGWLEQTQVAQGPAAGSWSYGKGKGTGDNSNSQFALLALHEAARAGARVKAEVWMKAQQYWVSC